VCGSGTGVCELLERVWVSGRGVCVLLAGWRGGECATGRVHSWFSEGGWGSQEGSEAHGSHDVIRQTSLVLSVAMLCSNAHCFQGVAHAQSAGRVMLR
jgi:hypothetical protein